MSELHEISLRERIRLNLVSSMEAANINQVQLADKLGISKGTVNNWARGNNSPDVVMGEEEARVKEQAEMEESFTQLKPKIIPLFWSAAAAGIAAPILGEEYDLYELTPEDPQGAMLDRKSVV